jgi:hypothetical protein
MLTESAEETKAPPFVQGAEAEIEPGREFVSTAGNLQYRFKVEFAPMGRINATAQISQPSGLVENISADEILRAPAEDRKPAKSMQAAAVVRRHLLDSIISDLKRMETLALTPAVAVPTQNIFYFLRRFTEELSSDSLSIFLSSVYEAFAFEDRWATMPAEKIAMVQTQLANLTRNSHPNLDSVERSIMKLEETGIDTLPLGTVTSDEEHL